MNYQVTPQEKSTVKIEMTFSPEEWADANQKAYLQNRNKYSVNGFRKGKVPKHVLELYYGKAIFFEDALNDLFAEHYPEIIEKEEENFTVVGEPSVSLGEDFSEENVVLVAVTPVKPDVTIGAYTGIKINRFEYTVTDADVEAELQAVRERVATSVEVTDRAAALTDTVTIDFEGRVDGELFEGGSAKGHELVLGSGQFIPGFEEGVVGMKVGETKDVNVTFPEDYQAEELKGKPAVFAVTLHKIMGRVLPELNDELAQKMGSADVAAFRATVRERLERNAKTRSVNETENAILTEIAKTATADIPDALVDRQEEVSLQRMERSLSYQGIPLDDYLQYVGTTREEYKKNFEEEARRDVLHQLVLEKLMKELKIEATAEEIEKKIADQAASVGKEKEEYEKTMDPRQREYIENDIKVTKLFDFLQANNEMVDFKEEKRTPSAKKSTKKKEEKPAEEPSAAPEETPSAAPEEAPAEAPAKPKKRTAKKEEN